MVVQLTTTEAFEQFIAQPENEMRLFELIGGEVVEVPSNPFASKIAMRILIFIGMYLQQHDLGHLTGEAGGYIVDGERYAPDVAFISYARQRILAQEGYNPAPPDLAVEVDFPSTPQSQRNLRIKLFHYLNAGTVVWLVYPETQEIEVYVPGKRVEVLSLDNALNGGEVLPGFTLPLKDIFQ
jgi:Uma2 family endonuclease